MNQLNHSHAITSVNDVWSIWYASRFGKVDRLHYLLRLQKNSSINSRDKNTLWTPLHVASKYGQQEIVDILVNEGADTESLDSHGNTPLHLSAGWGNVRTTTTLLEAGAEIWKINDAGQSPQDIAQLMGQYNQVRILHKWKINVNDDNGLMTQSRHIPEIIDDNYEYKSSWDLLNKLLMEEKDSGIRMELISLYTKMESFGCEHPGLLDTLTKLTDLYRGTSKFDLSMEMAERGFNICKIVHGNNTIPTCTWINTLGELNIHRNNISEGLAYFKQAYDQLSIMKGGLDNDVLTILENLTITYTMVQDYPKVEQLLKTLIANLQKLIGNDCTKQILLLRIRLGDAVFAQKRAIEACGTYETCLCEINKLHGKCDKQILIECTDAIARCYFVQGQFMKAEEYFKQSLKLQIGLEVSKSMSTKLQIAYNNLAIVAIAKKSTKVVSQQLSTLYY